MRLATSSIAVLFLALAAHAEDKIDIKPNVKKGLKFTRTSTMKAEGDCKLGGGGGGIALVIPVKMDGETVMLEEVKDAKAGVPVESRRQYKRRHVDMNMGMGGEQDVDDPLQGADIVFAGGKKTGSTPNGALAEKDLENEDISDVTTLLVASGKTVSAGNTWDADKEVVKRWFRAEFPGFTPEEGEIQVKLGEFRDKDNVKCVRLEIEGKCKGKLGAPEQPASDVEINVDGDVFYSIDSGMTISTKVKGELKGKLKLKGMVNGETELDIKLTYNLDSATKVGEADFAAKPADAPPKVAKPERMPSPTR